MIRDLFRQRSAALVMRARGQDVVELIFYDEIGPFGITAADVAERLAEIEAPTIHLRLNSPGGDVFEGVAIYNRLREHPATIVTYIDGVAGSIASVIALAGDKVHMARNAFFMIHNPWAVTIGDAARHRQRADTLDNVGDVSIAAAYRARTGLDRETVETWMDAETWFNAEKAKEVGFVDVVEDTAPAEARAVAFDLSIYQHVPEALLQQESRDGDRFLTVEEWRDLETALRDEGLSRKDAVTALSGLKKWRQRDAGAPSTPPRDEVRADLGPDAALAAAQAILANLTVGAIHTERFAP